MAISPTTTTVPLLWTQKETAEYLAVSEKWLERDRWIGASIPFVKVGRLVRYRAEDVRAYVEKQTQPAA